MIRRLLSYLFPPRIPDRDRIEAEIKRARRQHRPTADLERRAREITNSILRRGA